MGGSSPKTQTVTQTNNPPAYAMPYLKDIMGEAQGLYRDNGPEYYPGSTVVPMAGETTAALDAQTQRALMGSPLNQAAQGTTLDVLKGNFLSGGNPYFQGAFDAMARPVTDAVQAAMARSGRLGSGAETMTLTRELGDIGSKLMYQNYNDERNRMMQASQFAPMLAETDYNDIAKLAQVGGAYEAQAGAELQDDVNRFTFYQQRPWDKLAQYSTFVQGGTYGGQNTTTQPVYSNTAGSILGGLSSAAGIAGSLIPLFCWVARAVYGPGEDFTRVRRWMLFKSPKWLLRVYLRHGERFARVVRKHPLLRRAVKLVMDRVGG
jgi:hypothetical protein